jgi:hypothetical protein
VTGFAPCVDFDALSAVDAVEARKVTAEKSGTLTPSGVLADTLQFAASTLAPKLQKAKRAVEQAKSEAAERRAKLVLKPADKTDAAARHTISERGLASSALSIMMSPLAPTLPSFKNDGCIVFGNV